LAKTKVSHYVKQEGPIDYIKGFGDVELDEQGWDFLDMQGFDHFLNRHKAVMQASFLNESCLAVGNNVL
jgi:hypothetical protein